MQFQFQVTWQHCSKDSKEREKHSAFVTQLWLNFQGGCTLLGEGNGTPLQYSCLENPMDGGAWWAAVHGVAKSWTRLSDFTHFSLSCIREGNGNLLQWSCLENPRDGGAWWAAVYGVAQSRTRLKRLSSIRETKDSKLDLQHCAFSCSVFSASFTPCEHESHDQALETSI